MNLQKFNREVQRTSIKLVRQLEAAGKMPNVLCDIKDSAPMAPIALYRKTERGYEFYADISIQTFLSFDIPAALAAGGTIDDLYKTKKRRAAS